MIRAYFNAGNGLFKGHFKSKYYVDKSGLIDYTNSVIGDDVFKYMCVSRPRRFGKSFAADMLTAYYVRGCDSHAMFDGREVSKCEDYDTHINKYNVIHVDISSYMKSCRYDASVFSVLDDLQTRLAAEIMDEYPDIVPDPTDKFSDYLNTVYKTTDIPFVFIIDEWDAIFRNRKDDVEGQKAYLNFLESMLKGKEYVALAYMTGILPIKKYGTHSALNMFKEYTMLRPGPV
ncbi:MAG: AAA family ATPase, partial [Clostridia bacterium]|nr:AAA family ATPase [Clostridia bacterium]